MNLPPKLVVVATDLSKASQAALQAAAFYAENHGSALHLVHVFDPSPFRAPSGLAAPNDLIDQAAEEMRGATESNLAALAKEALPGHVLEVVGLRHVSAGEAISDYATKVSADLVIVGSHGRTGLRRILLGSVAERVVRLSPCAVLVIR